MRKITLAALVIALIILLTVTIYISTTHQTNEKTKNVLFQVNTFNALSSGQYDGNTTFAQLAKHGDFGIGTLNGLNGEMIALDGVFYQIPVTGIPQQISSSEQTPYATVAFFEPNQSFTIYQANFSTLSQQISANVPSNDSIYAIEVHGYFDSAQTRSVPMQTKPYPVLSEAIKNQTIFNLNGTLGTAVGFYFPKSMDGVDFAGYHLHFITDDHSAGGHLLECNIKNATVKIDKINNFSLQLP